MSDATDDLLAGLSELWGELGQPWRREAACRGMDPDLFHPHRGSTIPAECRALCWGSCTVRVECAEYAITKPEQRGVWGGMSERERRRERARRRLDDRGRPPRRAA